MTDSLMNTYSRLPVTFVRGDGALLWDTDGKQYLDAVAGVAVCSLGHANPAITKAICEQASRLVHCSNLYRIQNQEILGDKLISLSGMDRVFFSNSGAEANEAAIKLARMYGHSRGITMPTIVVMENSFHGRTLATLTATGNRKVQAGFEPLVQGFTRVPYGDIEALEHVARNSEGIVAVLVEPVQGEGGVNVPPADYLPKIRALCDKHQWLMMLDEIQTGMGRTGKPFAFQHSDIKPDVMTLAKALGNGVPIGACLARGKAAQLFAPGNHGSTFGGNPLACAAAIAVVDSMSASKLWERAARLGEWIVTDLKKLLDGIAAVKDVRGLGMMIGIELDRPCAGIVAQALAEGLLVNVTSGNVIRLLPPLVMTDEQAAQLTTLLTQEIKAFLAQA